MRVTINREEKQNKVKTGFFSSQMVTSYLVLLTVEFSETELAIIRKSNLGDTIIYQRHLAELEESYIKNNIPYKEDAVFSRLTIDRLIKEKPVQSGFNTPLEANSFEQQLKSEVLPTLKSFITNNTTQGPKSEMFEL